MIDRTAQCLVLCADNDTWRDTLAPALAMASAPDGRTLRALRVDPEDEATLLSDDVLDALAHAALVVVDLCSVDPETFRLVEWIARVRPSSALLFRHGDMALPFELHEFLVRTLATPRDPQDARDVRMAVARLATLGASAREHEGGLAGCTVARHCIALQRRRARSGVLEGFRQAARLLVHGDPEGARMALAGALEKEKRAPDLLLLAAVLDRLRGRWHDALVLLRRAVRRVPQAGAAWRELGLVRLQAGVAGATDALGRAVELTGDFEATVALALAEARDGDGERAVALLNRAMEVSGGQLNLVLPALEARARVEQRLAVNPWEVAHLDAVLAIRGAQAQASPPRDAPWSHFDVARAQLLLGRTDDALATVTAAAGHLTAPWQPQTFGHSLDAFEAAGVDVAPLRAALGLRPAAVPGEGEARADVRPFRADLRDAAWFTRNVPCMAACPVGTDAGAYVHHLAHGRLREAFHVARAPNPFASVCGRICAAPCEDACRRGAIDEPVQIRALKRFLTERHGVEGFESHVDDVLQADHAPCIEGEAYLHRVRGLGRGADRRVAIVGGGPAGLACAHDLALLGYGVTVFEASHQLGGMMRQGIPIYRLSRDLIELEIGAILSLGVEVRLGTRLAADPGLQGLFDEGFDAVFLASGAGRGRQLDVESAHLDGVVPAIEFLLNANQGYRMDLGSRVVVVGGGNVALDVARTARLGRAADPRTREQAGADVRAAFGPELAGGALRKAVRGAQREVHVIARQPMGEWPAQRTVQGTRELAEAREEGVVFHPLRGVRRFLGSNGRLIGVELAEVVSLYDAAGRYAPTYGAHVAEVIPCDTAFLAVGQDPALDYLASTPDVRTTRGGLIEVDRETLATTRPGVYAGGDAAFGPRTLIEGVGDGKRAARSIHAYLGTSTPATPGVRFEVLHPRDVGTVDGYDAIGCRTPRQRDLDRRTGMAEVELGFDEAEALEQAGRCLVCHVQTIYDGSLCIACGRCTDVCPHACLSFVTDAAVECQRPLAAPPAEASVLMIKDEDRCIRCGLCAERCPTGAMTMERVHLELEPVS